MRSLDIVLPVYNGQRFLAQQIESIMNQHRVTTHLLCRDDGSSDGSTGPLKLLTVSRRCR